MNVVCRFRDWILKKIAERTVFNTEGLEKFERWHLFINHTILMIISILISGGLIFLCVLLSNL